MDRAPGIPVFKRACALREYSRPGLSSFRGQRSGAGKSPLLYTGQHLIEALCSAVGAGSRIGIVDGECQYVIFPSTEISSIVSTAARTEILRCVEPLQRVSKSAEADPHLPVKGLPIVG